MLPAFSFSVLPGGKGKSRVSALFKTGASVSFSAAFRGMPVLPLEAGRACLLSGELLAGKACVFVICELSEPAGAAGTELALIV